jgi:predicted kinase
MLVVFGGLPGTGKTTIAQAVARQCRATYLRIDTIEQALRSAGGIVGQIYAEGYIVAYALAETNLRHGQLVVADCVNPLAITRNAWRDVAKRTTAKLLEIEVICSDPLEHRRRVESRVMDIPDLVPATWEEVVRREYAPWSEPRLVVDTAALDVSEAITLVAGRIEAALN